MTKENQQAKILKFIARGKEIEEKEKCKFAGVSRIKGPMYEAWMSEINVFNERYLKDHPLHSAIHSAFFHRNTNHNCFYNMMGHLQTLAQDVEY